HLTGITVTLVGPSGGTITMGIRMGAAPSAQPLLFQQVVTLTGSAMMEQQIFVDMTSVNIPLSVGTIFVMEVSGSSNVSMVGSYVAPPGMPLYSEPLYLNGMVYSTGGFRLGFMSYVNTCIMPGMACDDGDPCTTNDMCDAVDMCT